MENLDSLRDTYCYFSFSMALWLTFHFETKRKEENQLLYFPVEVVNSMEGCINQLFHCPPYTASATSCPPLKKTNKQTKNRPTNR